MGIARRDLSVARAETVTRRRLAGGKRHVWQKGDHSTRPHGGDRVAKHGRLTIRAYDGVRTVSKSDLQPEWQLLPMRGSSRPRMPSGLLQQLH